MLFFAAVARTEPSLRLLEVTLDFYKLSQAGLAYVQNTPPHYPKKCLYTKHLWGSTINESTAPNRILLLLDFHVVFVYCLTQ